MKKCYVILVCFMALVLGLIAQSQSAIVGTWDCQFKWEDGRIGTAVFIFNNDGTMMLEGSNNTGKWKDFGNGRVVWIFFGTCVTYSGTIGPDGKSMSGSISGFEYENGPVAAGTWSGTKRDNSM